jgi:hypothetical protein
VVATVQPTEAGNLAANLPVIRDNDFLRLTALDAIDNLHPIQPSQMVFTDNRAPIELMTNALLFDFILGGDQ